MSGKLTVPNFGPNSINWPGNTGIVPTDQGRLAFTLIHLIENGTENTNELMSAFNLGCSAVNQDNTVLTSSTVTCVNINYTRNSINPILTQIQAQTNVIGIVGATLSGDTITSLTTSTQLPGNTGFLNNINMISAASASALLSNKTKYPRFKRTVFSDDSRITAFVNFIKYYNWKQLAIVNSDEPGSRNLCESLPTALGSGVKILGKVRFTSNALANQVNLAAIATTLSNTGAAVFVACAIPTDLVALFDYATNKSITGRGFTWLTTDMSTVNLPKLEVQNPNALTGMLGSISIIPRSGYGTNYNQFVMNWLQQNPLLYPGSVFTTGTTQPYAAETYDAVYAISTAVDSLVKSKQDYFNSTLISNALYKLNYNGTTGVVAFDTNGNRVNPVFQIVNIIGTQTNIVGTANTTLSMTGIILWGGGSFDLPSDQKPLLNYINTFVKKIFQSIDVTSIPPGIVVLIVFLFLILIGLIAFIIFMIIKARRGKALCQPKRYFQEHTEEDKDKEQVKLEDK